MHHHSTMDDDLLAEAQSLTEKPCMVQGSGTSMLNSSPRPGSPLMRGCGPGTNGYERSACNSDWISPVPGGLLGRFDHNPGHSPRAALVCADDSPGSRPPPVFHEFKSGRRDPP